MVTRVVERSPLLRAKPMMKDASSPDLSDEKNQTIGRDASLMAVHMLDDDLNGLPETKGRELYELSNEKIDRRSSFIPSAEKPHESSLQINEDLRHNRNSMEHQLRLSEQSISLFEDAKYGEEVVS